MNKTKIVSRKMAREAAMKLIYELEIHKDDWEKQFESEIVNLEAGDNDIKYINKVVRGVYTNLSFLDANIENNARGWKLNRISKVELAILRLALYEIAFIEDIPFSVSVNEAVELAKKYSTKEAGSFVNGILANFENLNNSKVAKEG